MEASNLNDERTNQEEKIREENQEVSIIAIQLSIVVIWNIEI